MFSFKRRKRPQQWTDDYKTHSITESFSERNKYIDYYKKLTEKKHKSLNEKTILNLLEIKKKEEIDHLGCKKFQILNNSISEIELCYDIFNISFSLNTFIRFYAERSIDKIKDIPALKLTFEDFLLKRKCTENFKCYNIVIDSLRNKDLGSFHELLTFFIETESEFEVNISDKTRQQLLSPHLLTISSKFEALRCLKAELKLLIENDVVGSFLESDSLGESVLEKLRESLNMTTEPMKLEYFKVWVRRNAALHDVCLTIEKAVKEIEFSSN